MALHRVDEVQASGRGASAGLLINGIRVVAGIGLVLSCAALIPDDEQDRRTEAAASTAETEAGNTEAEASASRDIHLASAAIASEVITADARAAAALCDSCSVDGSDYGRNSGYVNAGSAGNTRPLSAPALSREVPDVQAPSAMAAVNSAAAGRSSASPATDMRHAALAPSPSPSTSYWRPEAPTSGLLDTVPAGAPESYTPLRVAINELYAQPESTTPPLTSPASIAPGAGPSAPTATSSDPSGFTPAAAFDPARLAAVSPVCRREAPLSGGGDLPKAIDAAKAADTARGVDTAKAIDTAKATDTGKGVDTAKGTDTAQGIDTAKGLDAAKVGDTAKGVDTAGGTDTLKTPDEPSTTAATSPPVSPSGTPEMGSAVHLVNQAPVVSADSPPSPPGLPTKTPDEIRGIERPYDVAGAPIATTPIFSGAPELVINRLLAVVPGTTAGCCGGTTPGTSPQVAGSGPVDVLFSGTNSPIEHIADTAQTPSTPTTYSFLQPVTDVAISAPTALLAAVVPEPSTLALLGLALWGLALSGSSRQVRTIDRTSALC